MKDPYFSIKKISQSGLKIFEVSPMHYKHSLDNPIVPTAPMLFGSLVHYVVLEEHMVNEYCFILDFTKRPFPSSDFRNKENQKWRDNFMTEAQLSGKVLYSKEDYDIAQRMRDLLYLNPQSKEILSAKDNTFESATFWRRGKSECKAKIDIKNPYFLADLKTARDADPIAFQRTIFDLKYDRQGSMYLDGDAQGKLSFDNMKEYMIIAIEPEPPHGISVHRLRREVIQRGYYEYIDLTKQLQTCLDTDIWPGYEYKANYGSDGIFDVGLPSYLRN